MIEIEDLPNIINSSIDEVIPDVNMEKYPKEAVPPGTFARSVRLNRLGIVVDAFYGDVDTTNQKIIVYSMLLFPNTDSFSRYSPDDYQYYITNEYEYETIAYLMMKPVDIRTLKSFLVGEEEI
jgi:hypothetical protein